MKLLSFRVMENHSLTGDNHFFDCDNEENFKKNLKQFPLNWPWRTKKIQYILNSQYYRAPEWHQVDWNNSYLIFGCSETFGVGINYTDTYVHHLSELLGYPTVNLGIPGTSCMFQWSNTLILLNNKITPKGVIYLWPNINRMLIFKDGDYVTNYGPWMKNAREFGFWMDNVEHCIGYTKRLIDSVDLMWSCPTYHFHRVPDVCREIPKLTFIKTRYHNINDMARDHIYRPGGAHPGPKSNFDWAMQMFKVISKA